MDRYDYVSRLARILGVTAGVIVAKFVNDWAAGLKLSTPVTILLALVALAATSEFLKFAFDVFFGSAKWLRRLLLGDMFVEGTWLEIVRKDNAPITISVAYIRPNGYSIRFGGENFDTEGRSTSTFRADMVMIEWPRLHYKNTRQPSDGSASRLEGYGELQFTEREGGPPLWFSGFFLFASEGIRHNVVAMKLTDKEKRAQLDDPLRRREVLLAFAKMVLDPPATIESIGTRRVLMGEHKE